MSIHGPAAINIKRLEERPELGPREAFIVVQTNELLKIDRARFVRIGEIKQGFVFCSLLRQPHVLHLAVVAIVLNNTCLLYTSPSPRDKRQSRMPSSA